MSIRAPEIIGHEYGMLRVLSVEREHNGHRWCYYAICSCECGLQKRILVSSLKAGRTTSCGCRRDQYDKIRGANSSQFTGFGEITGTFWKGYRLGAERRNLAFDLAIEEAWDLFLQQDRRCAFTGELLVFGVNAPMTATTASLDRINITRGYELDNVQWVHKTINLMRNILEPNVFVEWCRKVILYNDSVLDR